MSRFLLAAVIAAGALTAAVPASAQPVHPVAWDRVENRIDRREDRFDRRHDGVVTVVDRWGWHHPRW